ncbi:MAG: MFS transporter [Pseudonocardia sp.]
MRECTFVRRVREAMRSRWTVLAAGTLAQAATAAHFLGLAAVTPALRAHYGLGLVGVGALIGVISVGIVTTLILWGSAADRFGERGVMTVGLLGAAALLAGAGSTGAVTTGVLLFLAGASGAAVNAASGRAVLTWFPGRQRGLAMAVRQTSVPLGAGLAALTLPAIAARGGVPAVFLALAGLCAIAALAVALWVREPPDPPARPGAGGRVRDVLGDRRLLRLSLAGALLVVPQFVGSALLVEVLLAGGLTLAVAGGLLGLTQALGALGRLGNGWWSDRVGNRLGPLRIVAVATAAGFGLAAALQPGPAPLLAAVLVPAAALAISWNGLVFTAAGELAPPGRAATAMATSNTANYVAAALTPALGGLVAQVAGWPTALALGGAAAIGAVLALHRVAEPRAGFVTAVVPHRTDAGPQGTVSTGQ